MSLVEAKRNLQILLESGLIYLGEDRRYRLNKLGLFITNFAASLDIVLKMWKDFEALLNKIPKDLLPSPIELSGLEIVKELHLIINYANKIFTSVEEEVCAMNIAELIPFLNHLNSSLTRRKITIRVILNGQNLKALCYHHAFDNLKNIRIYDKNGLIIILLNEHSGMIVEPDNAWIGLVSTTFQSYKFIRNIFDYFWKISSPYTETLSSVTRRSPILIYADYLKQIDDEGKCPKSS
ncbi:MAG: hypothetical protein QXY58_01985 [Nitrososphaerota archaeon]